LLKQIVLGEEYANIRDVQTETISPNISFWVWKWSYPQATCPYFWF